MKQAKLPQAGLLILVIGIYTGLAWFNSLNIPLSKAPDEYVHFRYIRFIVENGRLPQTNVERQATGYKADQPPLYYGLVALVTSWIKTDGPPTLKMTWDSPRRKLIDLVLPRAMIVRTEDETWPYAGIVLAWMVGRWLSILMGIVTIILVYLVTAEIFPTQPDLALAAAATLAFIPCFTYISAVLSDENLLGVVVGLYFWGLVRFSKGQRDSWTFMVLGLLMGLAVITKYSAVVLPLEFLLVLAVLARRRPWPWRRWAQGLVTIAIAGVFASGGWFLFQAWYFNRAGEFGPVAGVIRPLIAGDESLPGVGLLAGILTGTASAADRFEPEMQGSLWTWLVAIFTKFWVVEIVGAQPPFPPLLTVSLMLGVVLIAGVGWWLIWRRYQGQERDWLGLLLLHLFIFVPIPLLRFLLSGRINDTAQARYLVFSAAPTIGILLAWGIAVVAREKYRHWALLCLVGVMASLSGVSAYHFWTGFPAPLPVRTDAMLAVSPRQPLSIRFNDGFELTGYDQQISGDGSTLQVTLYWRSLAYAHEDYETHLSLLDNKGQVVAVTAAQPAQGRYPVRAWDPGDAIHDVIALPLTGILPGSYQVRLRLRGWETWLKTTDGAEAVILTQVDLPAPAEGKTSPQHVLAGKSLKGFSVWNKGRLAGRLPLYRYLADIPITIDPFPLQGQVQLWLVGPDNQRRPPVTAAGPLQTFIVEYDWPSGEYRLEAEVEAAHSVLERVESEPVLRVENKPWSFQPPAMGHRLEANFDDKILLLGYDLPLRRVQPSEGLPVLLHWQALQRMREDYVMFVRLLDADQQVWGGYDRLPQETYSTILWVPGEVVSDGFVVPIKEDAPKGMYYLALGFYYLQEGQPVSLPLVQNGSPTEETRVLIGPVKVGGPPPGVTLDRFTPQVVRDDQFGDNPVIRLKGYDLDIQAGQLRLTLYWQSEMQTEIDYTRFVHLRDPQDQTVAQSDGLPGGGSYLTSLWDPGEIIPDTVTVPLPAELLPGEYTLAVGLYEAATGQRLPVPASAGDNSLRLPAVSLP